MVIGVDKVFVPMRGLIFQGREQRWIKKKNGILCSKKDAVL